jgi:ankyrin repeat protein
MALPAHLLGKLRQEYARAAEPADAIRCAITMAALYSGVIGTQLSNPWDTVAKIQWLLKAVELGSHAAISPLMANKNSIAVLEEFGPSILSRRHQSFESPHIDEEVLHSRLRGFSEMPDEESANILVWLGGTPDWDTLERRLQQARGGVGIDEQRVHTAEENLRQLSRFTINRRVDFEVVDSDAFDMVLADASPIERSVYHNALEDFIRLSEEQGLEPKDETAQSFMAKAIFHGSLEVVRYLSTEYTLSPNDIWHNMSHLDHAILFSRIEITQYFLERGGVINPAQNDKPSALHLAARADNVDLINMLCKHLKAKGQLERVLESRTSTGPLEGWTVAYAAACCQSWKCLEVLFSFGADPNCVVLDEPRIIENVIRPQTPAISISVLKMVLEAGAQPSYGQYLRSPLQWAVGSSNVLALHQLLLHGATVSDAALVDAAENVEDEATELLPVVDEHGDRCLDGWINMCAASRMILKLLQIGKSKRGNWRQDLDAAMVGSSPDCKGKLWIANENATSYFIEVRIPD